MRIEPRLSEDIMRILLIGTIFLSAFLLFLVQPIIAKQIIPWFGGTSAVWATCMMFFQVTLLMGYAYSDFVVRRIQPRTQSLFHIGLLLAALLALPIIPDEGWKPTEYANPTLQVFMLLLFTVGLPYFALSTTGPLLQAWYVRRFPGNGVYRLFALSNLASLAALVSYPFVIEPYFTTRQQSWGWSIGFALFALSCMLGAWNGRRDAGVTSPPAVLPGEAATGTPPSSAAPRAVDYLTWLSLAALGSTLLLSVTNHITQNVASVPLLWILPLSAYLLTFILCFDRQGWYRRRLIIPPLMLLLVVMAWGLAAPSGYLGVKFSVLAYILGLFFICMFVHGELARRKPAPSHLTRFYLMVSLGGVLGSFFVSTVAPYVFSHYFELPIALVVTGLVLMIVLHRYFAGRRLAYGILAVSGFGTFFTGYFGWLHYSDVSENAVHMQRNFYGTLSVISYTVDSPEDEVRDLVNGTILHGRQFSAAEKRNKPTTYFGEGSAPAYALEKMKDRPLNVGVVGLGVGTVALYGKPGDYFRFYELNPQDKEIAQHYFSYLHDSPARTDVVLGDGRLSLERELKEGRAGQFDILMLDAFNSASVPVHLLTREAMDLYRLQIKPDGVIIFNTTNAFLNLPPLIKRIADDVGMQAIKIAYRPERHLYHLLPSNWVLVTRNERILEDLKIQPNAQPVRPLYGLRPWTDDYSNLFQILAR
jgi:hypothetical protein